MKRITGTQIGKYQFRTEEIEDYRVVEKSIYVVIKPMS